jgi:acyl-CoA thioester hydrolase
MDLEQYNFTLEFDVRDYECDMDGVVNNANYLHYLEHTRNECLKTMDLNYAVMTKEDRHLFVARVNIEFKYPLRSNDKFIVALKISRPSTASLDLKQDIYRLPDHKAIINAKVVIVGMEGESYRLPKPIIDKIPLTSK